MKTLKITTLIAIALLVSMSFASQKVKSKLGDIDLVSSRGGSTIVCTVHFDDELTLIKQIEADALVKGICQGWVAKDKIEYVAKAPGDNSVNMEEYKIGAWIDNPTGVFVLDNSNIEDFEKVTIDRDFREYLTYTMDREQTEMRNGEN